MKVKSCGVLVLLVIGGAAVAQETIDTLVQRGEELYTADVGCWVCHAQSGEGLLGPSLLNGPTPADIYNQLQTNPMMGVIVQEVNPSDEDLIALSMYIRQLAGLPLTDTIPAEYRQALAAMKASRPAEFEFPKTERDLAVEAIESFGSVLTDWERKADPGSIARSYASRVVATFDAGEPKFEPQRNTTYFYENLGTTPTHPLLKPGLKAPASSQIVVGDAATKEIIASYELSPSLRAAVHTTVLSPDGKYVYIVGAGENASAETSNPFASQATLIKVDAVTLQPVKQITTGGRLHHGQVFQDRYLLLDTFSRDPDGLDVLLFDPETDTVLGGVRDEELGGRTYTSFTDGEFIYVLMQPDGYGPPGGTGFVGARNVITGRLTTMRPFWIAKLDPETWEVVKEYPYPGYRGTWITFDSAKEYMYITTSGSSQISKINVETGVVEWTNGTGISPYGNGLNADESEVWSANKGEHVGKVGRTITVFETATGQALETLFSGYAVDHVLLAPNGKEMWATSNGEGSIYVFDVQTREQVKVIEMPQYGDAHGLVWVHYDDAGESRVVRDQGGFHGGINPALGSVLEY
jgi:DNA-binding beta-propeller fold protein YncE/mono/diheme cytochrome c family protein